MGPAMAMARLERQVPGVMQLAGMGVELAGAILGGCLLGYWIDRHFETRPWGLLIGASMGIVGGLYNMIRKALSGPPLAGGRRGPGPGGGSGAGSGGAGAGSADVGSGGSAGGGRGEAS